MKDPRGMLVARAGRRSRSLKTSFGMPIDDDDPLVIRIKREDQVFLLLLILATRERNSELG